MIKMGISKRSILISLTAISVFVACGRKKSDDDEGSSSNTLQTAYPSGLSLAIFPQSTGTGLALEDTEKVPTLKERKEEAEKVIGGSGDCLPPAFGRGASPNPDGETCYEFDQEMIYGGREFATKKYGTVNGKNASGEACLVAFARTKVKDVENIIDRGLGLVQGMMCQAKKDGKAAALPAVGASLDLTESLKTAMGAKATSVSAATIKRLADVSSRPVYRIDIKVTTSDGATRDMHLLHSPLSESDNTQYKGKLWTKTTGLTIGPKLALVAAPTNQYLSIVYAKDATTIQAELLRGKIADSLDTNAFVKGVLDLNVGADANGNYTGFAQANEAVDAMTYVGFNLNQEDNTGTTSYWQNPGGNYTENARGMVFNLKKENGVLVGCGSSGATTSNPGSGLSIRKSRRTSTALEVKGFYHPFFYTTNNTGGGGSSCTAAPTTGTDTVGTYSTCTMSGKTAQWYNINGTDANKGTFLSEQNGSLFTRQCVKQNASGVYEIDTANVTNTTAGFDIVDYATAPTKSIPAPDVTGLSGIADMAVE